MSESRRGFLRMSGLDRSGPRPDQTRKGAPLRPFTLPNLVGYVRIMLLVGFVWVISGSGDGRSVAAFLLLAGAAGGDYVDGFLARLTGQYSRLGTLMDPLIDRLLVLCAVVASWYFELLPRWALAIMVARELLMLAIVAYGLARGLDIEVNMVGRVSVFFVMGPLVLVFVLDWWVVSALFYVGVAGSLAATVLYLRDGVRQLRAGGPKQALGR